MYLEVAHEIFTGKGSVAATANYVNGFFSQVILLYSNESVNMTINELVIWDVDDPYTGPSTSDYLTQFRDALAGSYNGDLAHLLGYNGGGGIAYVDVVCNSFYGVGYSGVNSGYNNVPAYSWTVEVVTHELGHNLGSPHTHACAWNGNNTAIDGCGPAAGYSEGCNAAVPASGTIMSYCHLVGGVGIDFNLGFGSQPGDRIRDRVYNGSCLTSCATVPLSVSITSSSDISCSGTNDGSATASGSGGTGNYTYSWSNGGTGATISNLSAGGYIVTVADGNTTATDTVIISDPNNTYYADTDNDSYGDPNNSIIDCSAPIGYVAD